MPPRQPSLGPQPQQLPDSRPAQRGQSRTLERGRVQRRVIRPG
ncbi:hypothetical protein AB0D42_39375 [Streptomyces sp. NPDC048304]